jgi:hypothetical protein
VEQEFYEGEMGMADPSELSMVLNSALPATFTFLYQRLDALLSRHKAGGSEQAETLPEIPAVVVGELELPLRSDEEQVRVRRKELQAYALGLAQYHRNPTLITSDDPLLLETLGELRNALEDIYGQRLTFQGELRDQSGPFSEQRIGRVAGEAIGMQASQRIGDAAGIKQTIDTVERGGRAIGMKAPIIGDSH